MNLTAPTSSPLSAPSDLAVMRDEILGSSPALAEVLRQVDTVARTGATVLIHGETGTGKELVARAIHRRSARAPGPFVKVNCAAIPAGLLESELFGHEKGAFTGALARRTGRFELAQDGTLFLDEIGEMAAELQPKLLRLLQEREFERLGSSRTIQSNARLVAATHRDLGAMVEGRTFREDLYYRLNVFPLHLPPLRDRRGDISQLANAFVRRFARGLNKDVRGISAEAMARLERHDWPGNVRELQNVLERAVILTPSGEVGAAVIVERLRERSAPADAPAAATPRADALEEVERAHILSVLQKTNWVVAGPYGAAVRLGMKRSTLNFRMKKLGIVRNGEARRAG
jgi:transcriptional regulator with GAF, ATPase, and Fis domain